MFVPERMKTNAYRVLGLAADATLSEIHRAAGSMRRAVSLGVAKTTDADLPLLGEISRTESDIRSAIGRLENPTQRLSDRLFWFHRPLEVVNAQASVRPNNPNESARAHDEALRNIFAAFESGFADIGVSAWINALQRWHLVVSEDDYWAYIVELERQGAFEPAAFPSELDALRDEAVGLAAEPLIVAGRDALARDDSSTVRRILAALEVLHNTGPWSGIAQQDIAAPAVERLRASCDAVREEFGSKIVREQDSGELNKPTCAAAVKRFRDDIEPVLNQVLEFLPPHHEAAQRSRELAALCLSAIAADYTWADDFIASEALNEEALRLGQDTLGAIRIERGLAEVREAARKQRISETLTPTISAAIDRLRELCLAIREEYSSKIIREQNTGKHNKSICDEALERFRAEVKPALGHVLGLLPPDHDAALQARDEVALRLNAIATDYTWADDFILSEKLRNEALLLAHDLQLINLIEEGLAETREAARQQRLFGEPISSAPSLFTLNGFGVTLYGNSDYDKETQSFATTHYIVAFFFPLFPIGRYRVINAEGSQYRFLGKLPLRPFDRWHLGIAATVILAMIVTSSFSRQDSNVSYPPSANGSTQSSPTSSAPISRRSQLSALKARIDAGRSQMAVLKSQLQPVIDEITSLDTQMEPLKADLKSLDEQQKAGVQIDIDGYNATVKTYNSLLAKQRALIAANRTDLKTYGDLGDQDSALVKQYNALLK